MKTARFHENMEIKNNKNIMKTRFITLTLAASAILVGCKQELPNSGKPSSPDMEKILNLPEDADGESLLIYVDKNISGTDKVDSLAVSYGALSCRRVFPQVSGDYSEEQRFGLDRWYVIKVEKGTDLENLAFSMSSEKKISRIQFNSIVQPVSTKQLMPRPFKPGANTKAAGTAAPFNDPSFSNQWDLLSTEKGKPVATSVPGADVNVVDAWNLTAGDPSIIVAVVDEGVDYTHPDLKANMWTNPKETKDGKDSDGNGYVDDIHGYNFNKKQGDVTWNTVSKNTTYSDSGHGTHVAGTIAAVNNNGTGICGIAGGTGNNDGVKIMSCQIFSGGEGCPTEDVAAAIKYAADNGASILQCSWGVTAGYYKNDDAYYRAAGVEVDAIRYFESMDRKKKGLDNPINGGVAIFAGGNENASLADYPGALYDIIAVTAFASDNKPTGYTNYSFGCNIAAPGGELYTTGIEEEEGQILSTMPVGVKYYDGYYGMELYDGNGYGYMQGTSMACPHVSGVAALGLSYMKKLGKTCTKDEFKAMLLTSVNDLDQFCVGTKRTLIYSNGNVGNLTLSRYKGKMGTGSVDTWKLFMQIEGTPCLTAAVGSEQVISLESIFGSSYAGLTYRGVEISAEDKAKIGLDSDPIVKLGRLVITPTRTGNATITVKAIAGGNIIGGGSSIGGMEISKTFSLVARGVKSENGGWL